MNKKIATLVFTIFAGTVTYMNASCGGCGRDGGKDAMEGNNSRNSSCSSFSSQLLILAVLHNKLSPSDKRDSLGFSTTDDTYLNAWRNEPENGGPTFTKLQRWVDEYGFGNWYSVTQDYPIRQSALALTMKIGGKTCYYNHGFSLYAYAKQLAASSPEGRLIEIEKGIKAIEVSQACKAVTVQARAKTAEEEFGIAKKVVETSPELQAYAAALFAARK